MEKIERLALSSEEVLSKLKSSFGDGNEEEVVELLEELLERGNYFRGILDWLVVQIERGAILPKDRWANIISHTILKHTTPIDISSGGNSLRRFTEIVRVSKGRQDPVCWYEDHFGNSFGSGR